MFSYLFSLSPAPVALTNPVMLVLLIVSILLILASPVIRWRRKAASPIAKKLSKTWPVVSLGFGFAGFVFAVCRLQGIEFLSMRVLWVVWLVLLGGYLYLQYRLFAARYYQVLPKQATQEDPRQKYLPGSKS